MWKSGIHIFIESFSSYDMTYNYMNDVKQHIIITLNREDVSKLDMYNQCLIYLIPMYD